MLKVVYNKTINMDKIYRNGNMPEDGEERAYAFRNMIPHLSLGEVLGWEQREDLRYIGSWMEIEKILDVPINSIYNLFSELANSEFSLELKHLKPISLVFDVSISVEPRSLDEYM